MEDAAEIIPFVMEMLRQKPNRSLLKIYVLGSTLAILGAVGSVVDTIILPFVEKSTGEDELEELPVKLREKQVLKVHSSISQTDVVDTDMMVPPEAAKYLETTGQRSSAYRLHAS
ncbi:G0/G1 switch protein 2 isoform X2 [Salarias fasciatus]|uniref:G0/G1 switch protein 2 isoform X1 n=1 Tax=Salarias fasciatus TaxID=181472 RepID=UPI0011764F1C|nr:G0/G1 switch protein 2 isoform X1 [Salarias fasciatus]XP_029975170.1 G0/G1 switch protein 2 isoform X2 [Salarias fasciatus]